MLGKLVLLLLQIAGGVILTPIVMSYVPVPSAFSLYVFAIAAAIVIFLIGIIGAQVIKDVAQPSSATLTSALVLALVAAALWSFGPQVLPQVPWGKVPAQWAVLGAAILGYIAKR